VSSRRIDREADAGQQRELLVRVTVPGVPTCTAVLSAGFVGSLLAGGAAPSSSAVGWPLVVLTLGSMAYDLGVRALRHRGN
jgi:hypothetical protein